VAKKGGSASERPSGAKGVRRSWRFRTALLFLSPSPRAECFCAHEVTLVRATLASSFLEEKPQRLIGEKAYDSDPLEEALLEEGIEMNSSSQEEPEEGKDPGRGRKLRRYKRRRWKIERLFAWLSNFRRLVVRYEYKVENFLGMVQLGCIVILLRKCL
jgi:transposase